MPPILAHDRIQVTMQLDLFAHSREVTLRNDIIAALRAGDCSRCAQTIDSLATEYPQDRIIEPAKNLLAVMQQPYSSFRSHLDLAQALDKFQSQTVRNATITFGEAEAKLWLRPFYIALAEAASGLPYSPHAPNLHAAPLFLLAEQWAKADERTRAEVSWRRIPSTLAWAAQAGFHLRGLDETWPMLAELAWLDASRFVALCQTLPAPGLQTAYAQFEREASASVGDAAWFPAWALIEHPDLRGLIRSADTSQRGPAETACNVIAALLSLERQGRHHELVAQRRILQNINPELFAHYMRHRA